MNKSKQKPIPKFRISILFLCSLMISTACKKVVLENLLFKKFDGIARAFFPTPGPDLNKTHNIRFCLFAEESDICLKGSELAKNDVKSVKLIKTKLNHDTDKKYTLEVCFSNMEKLKRLTEKGSYAKRMAIYINDKLIIAPSFYGTLKDEILVVGGGIWDTEAQIEAVIGKKTLDQYKSQW
jgi:hypothetical protein